MDRQSKLACTVEVDGTGNGGGTGSGGSSATEAGFKQDALKSAKGLELPCPKGVEPEQVYIARMISCCHATVKGTFPTMSWLYPAIPPAACRLAGIEAKAEGVLLGIDSCKAN
ncbi:hypothetical protein H5407_00920 [Mitsuaria sp. WAJ17]|uniref:hypothetical protein n=1 Tax=Mitsuaria sp. WAJ17 TaxID=2761452 RepID=UPI00160413F8|nr:hypothetical protein [Mitsuaria sp. WAJ17]MBB2483780.1 hypothetical protein [Mitsuaria sp. WAJ17]